MITLTLDHITGDKPIEHEGGVRHRNEKREGPFIGNCTLCKLPLSTFDLKEKVAECPQCGTFTTDIVIPEPVAKEVSTEQKENKDVVIITLESLTGTAG